MQFCAKEEAGKRDINDQGFQRESLRIIPVEWNSKYLDRTCSHLKRHKKSHGLAVALVDDQLISGRQISFS